MLYHGYENLDKERLDRANLGWPEPRGQGRTFKYMMHMVSCAYVCQDESRYLYVGENVWWTKEVMRTLQEILKVEGFKVYREKDHMNMVATTPLHQVVFYFAAPPRIQELSQGPLWTDIFVDLSRECSNRYHRELYNLSHRLE